MAQRELSFLDYVKKAFKWRFKVPLLGYLRLNLFAVFGFAVLGFVHPGFWFIGLAAESAYLIFLPGNRRFQNLVKGQQLINLQETWKSKRNLVLTKLDAPSISRYQQLVEQCSFIQKNSSEGSSIDDYNGWGLNQLAWTFLQLLASRGKIQNMLRTVSEAGLAREIEDLENRLQNEDPKSTLYASHSSTLNITRKRLDNIRKAKGDLDVVEAELDRIERQFALLREETALTADPGMITAKLDGVMQSLQETSRWLSEHKEMLDNSVDEIPPELLALHSQMIKE